ncbi:MAG: T9SS type A sorting domain-containing protein, partial [Candidatus Cloacimonadales bacterium]
VGNLVDDSILSFCYMAGVINNSTAGALVGNIMTNAIINNCFWDYEISGSSQPIEINLDGTGVINDSSGLTTAEMKTETSYTENGWDFNEIWAIENNLNDGYPFHQNQEVAAPNESINLTSAIVAKNYPNPFNPSKTGRAGTTTIELSLSKACSVKIDIINLKGQKIKNLVHNNLPEGKHLLAWDGRNDDNSLVASGVYFYLITAGNEEIRKKMILMK